MSEDFAIYYLYAGLIWSIPMTFAFAEYYLLDGLENNSFVNTSRPARLGWFLTFLFTWPLWAGVCLVMWPITFFWTSDTQGEG